jgi:LacI family transcriptional regulator
MTTISDVAKLAGVSKTTVSRFLNDKSAGNMTEETKHKIMEAVECLNYKPNNIARSLKGKQTKAIGFIVHDISNPFFQPLVSGVESVLYQSGYSLVLCNTNLDLNEELLCLDTLAQRQIDGILLAGLDISVEHLKDFKADIPIVLLERQVDEDSYDIVSVDNFKGAYIGVEHLIQLGHKKIAHVTGNERSRVAKERVEAFCKCLHDYGMSVDSNYIIKGNYKLESGYEAMKRLMLLSNKPTAVFFGNDNMAVGGMRYLFENNIRIPDEISIVGFDDIIISSMITPPLTTIRQPIYQMGRKATSILLDRVNKKNSDKKENIILEPSLIVRSSTKKLN